MSEKPYSPSWYRVARLKPRLRGHVQIHRHHYRGVLWYVLQDLFTERFYRFSPSAYSVLALMDGHRTVEELWELASERYGDEAPSQDQVIQLLGQLHAADVLQCDVPPDSLEILRRAESMRRRKRLQQILSPMFWQFRLFDPEWVMKRLGPFVRPIFGRVGFLLWLAVVSAGAALAAIHWEDLSKDVIDRVLAPQNLVLLWLTFPVLKAFHEFGHAFAVKAFGGEVHEMGIMLLVLTPLPYVDASAASAFRSKFRRILVSGAGIMVETFIASVALMVWIHAEPGAVRTVLYNVIFIAGVSTLLFNGNPLLRYDGYYILVDLIEIPNLRARAYRYLGYLVERYLFAHRSAEPGIASRGEKAWFVVYGVCSFVYRLFVLTAIVMFVATKFFFVGVALAVWLVFTWLLLPVLKGIAYVFTSPRLQPVRARAVLVTSALVLLLLGLALFAPAPHRTLAEGVIWIPERSVVRAEAEGFLARFVAEPGTPVEPGDLLVVCENPVAEARVRVMETELAELRVRYADAFAKDRLEAQIVAEEIEYAQERLRRETEDLQRLALRSHTTGTFVVPLADDMPGRFVRKGTLIGYVLELDELTARVVVSQEDVDLVRNRTGAVEVRLAERFGDVVPASILREVPAASEQLPSPALGARGGGEIATDPTDTEGKRTVGRYFQLDLAVGENHGVVNVGGRVFVRFDHGWEPLGFRWYRSLRRLFLSRFEV